jgi:hypothetical protein
MLGVLTVLAILIGDGEFAVRAVVVDELQRTQWLSAMESDIRGPSADDPSPPAEPVKLIFIHHSCGGHWLADVGVHDQAGGLGQELMNNKYFVSATNYGWGPGGIGSSTDIPNWPDWFTGPSSSTVLDALYGESGQNVCGEGMCFGDWSRLASDPGGENEIIMFKSCYPNSDVYGNPNDPPASEPDGDFTVSNFKAVYNDLLATFEARQDKLFIVITAPPMAEASYIANDASTPAAERAANARAFNDWLVNDWLNGYAYNNVAVFDFFNVLTSNGSASRVDDTSTNGEPNDYDLRPDGNHHYWNGSEIVHTQTVEGNFSAYPYFSVDPETPDPWCDDHPTAAGNRKATAEFVPLLNIFYNRWRGGDETPAVTATAATATATSMATASPTGTAAARPTSTPKGTPPVGQQIMAFQDGVSPNASYAGTSDAILANDAEANANLGGAENLEVFFGEGEEHRRSLVRWDLSALPDDAVVAAATVALYRYEGGAEDAMQVALYRVTNSWTEGTGWDLWSDPSYVPDGATWALASPGTAWTTPGGDYDAAVVGQGTLPAGMGNGWVNLDATAAVRAWVEGDAPNYGLLLRPQSGDYSYHYYHSRNHGVPNLRPRLVVTYTVGGVPMATPMAAPTFSPTATSVRLPIVWGYLPVILKHWSGPIASRTVTRSASPTAGRTVSPTTGRAASPTATRGASPTPTSTTTTPMPSELIQPSDLVYQGAFAYPPGDEWAYSGHALTYYPDGDPSGSADGYPGSLYAAGCAGEGFDLVGEMSISEPVVAADFDDLPTASVLKPLTDITGGWLENCTYDPECQYRNVDGLAYLPNVDKIAWNVRDWYNVQGFDQDSLGWSDLDMEGAQGVWHIGDRPSDDDVFHNARTCNYLFKAPDGFADANLDGKWLIAGNHREAGALGGSQGPTLYALAPWEDGNPPASGQNLDALALLYYPEVVECVWEAEGDINEDPDPGVCHFPDYRAMDNWGSGVWLEATSGRGILIFGRKGLGDNCYGSTELCGEDPCAPSSGYHAYPYEPQILFYDPEGVEEALAGTREPWEVLPYEVHTVEEVLEPECAVLGAAAYDQDRGLIYVTEQEAGPWGETVVHVWRVE